MGKFAVGIEYAGTAYSGWQRQKHALSIQQHIEEAIGYVANHRVQLVCAGRTDAGVHAIEQVAHFESTAERDNRSNGYYPSRVTSTPDSVPSPGVIVT